MTSNPRILLVAGGFPLASETFVREQCLQLVERGVDLEILALRPGDGTWSERERAAGSLTGSSRRTSIVRPGRGFR